MLVTFYRSEKDTTPLTRELTWDDFSELFKEPYRARCTDKDCPGKDCVFKKGQSWSPAILAKNTTRHNDSVLWFETVALDLDHLTEDQLEQTAKALEGRAHLVHATHSSKPGDIAVRVILRLSHAVQAADWRPFLAQLVKELGVPADPACKDLSRLYFMPSRPIGADYLYALGEGAPVDVDAVLGRAARVSALPANRAPGSGGQAAARGGAGGAGEAPEEVLAKEGGRNAALTSLGGTMRRRGMTADAIEAALLLENAQRCQPPLPEDEVRAIVASVARYEPDAQALPKQGRTWGLETRFDELLKAPDQADEEFWLIQGVLAAGETQVVGGEPKSGKTLLLEHMAVCVASGTRWLDRYDVKRGRVLILPREDHQRETARRLRRICAGLGVNPDRLRDWLYVECRKPFRFDAPEDVRDMLSQIRDLGLSLVVLDPLAELHHCDENNSSEMGRVMDAWVELTNEGKCAVAVVHHWRKPPEGGGFAGGVGRRLRGSSRVFQRVRHMLGVEAQSEGRVRLSADGNLPARVRPCLLNVADALDAYGKPCLKVSWQTYDDARRRG